VEVVLHDDTSLEGTVFALDNRRRLADVVVQALRKDTNWLETPRPLEGEGTLQPGLMGEYFQSDSRSEGLAPMGCQEAPSRSNDSLLVLVMEIRKASPR
jgi:hypothetical protein